MMKRLTTLLLVAVLLCLGGVASAAEKYPAKAVSVIIPFAAGGGTDTQARLFLKYLEEKLGQPMVIVNRPGAGGEIGMTQISKAKADGYTLGVIAYCDSFIRSKYKETTYTNDDYVYIGTPVNSPVIFVAKPGSPFKNLEELVRHAKSTGNKITVGIASDAHYLAVKMFAEEAGIGITPVFFKSGAAASNALLGGHINTQSTTLQFGKIGVESGASVLGIANESRVQTMPDGKTFREQGYDVIVKQSRILVAPKGTPKDITDLLEESMREALAVPALIERINALGDVYDPLTGAELAKMIDETEKTLGPVVERNAAELLSGQQ
jgi:tripartite-type tricarboxylate transporter receptor subunit TctC